MTFSGHVSMAAVTLKLIPDPIAVILLNGLLHLVLDAIPHAEWSTFRNSKPKVIIITVLDLVVGLFLLYLMLKYVPWPLYFIIFTLLSGLWLDILDGATLGRLRGLRRFHESLHTWPIKPEDPVDWGKTVTGRTPTWLKVCCQALLVLWAVVVLVS